MIDHFVFGPFEMVKKTALEKSGEYRRSRQFPTVITVAYCQNNCSQSVSQTTKAMLVLEGIDIDEASPICCKSLSIDYLCQYEYISGK